MKRPEILEKSKKEMEEALHGEDGVLIAISAAAWICEIPDDLQDFLSSKKSDDFFAVLKEAFDPECLVEIFARAREQERKMRRNVC